MGSYNILREAATSRLGPERAKSTGATFATGAAAGVVTVYASQPFDTIKTRAQGAKGATTAEAVKDVWRSGGIKGFWSGSSMRLGRLVLSGGIVFTVYEQLSSMLSGSSR
jgi:solute carrier family 25 (mitochondrial citrate transporter), member 1